MTEPHVAPDRLLPPSPLPTQDEGNAVRVYTEGGVVAHLLGWGGSPNRRSTALCGRTAAPGMWFGTGDQGEHERALDMPLCASCTRIARSPT